VEPATITVTYGNVDNFVSTSTDREWIPRASILESCTTYDWQYVTYANNVPGDEKPMTSPYFDWKPTNNALVWTVSNLPTDQLLTNLRVEMLIQGNGTASNDGFGFMWNDNIAASKPSCRIQYFRRFDTLFSGYSDGVIKLVNWTLPTTELEEAGKTILQKIKENGYFHFLVGDDSSVDYFRLVYEYNTVNTNIVPFSCKTYTTGSTVSSTKSVYTDDTSYTISSIIDSTQYPFTGSNLISTALSDKSQTQSAFKIQISSATRFWLFLPSTLTLSWVAAAGWDVITGSSVTVKGTQFSVYTKRYDGPRWVIFGPPSGTTTSSLMYFVSYAPSPALYTPTSNPAASCYCSSTGDPHYYTWDNRRYDLYQPGIYHLIKSRDCTFDVQTLTFKYGSSVAVNGIVSVRYLNNTVTLARAPSSTTGGAWTGNPTVRLNGAVIGSTSSAGGMTATYNNASSWDISISAVGLTVKTVVSGDWFHVYPALSDPGYQRKVDGLCGNCDGNPANDFKYPACQNAIADTTTKLTNNDVAQWALSWAVPTAQQLANVSLLASNLGTSTYSSCLASPITPQCSDLVLPEPPKTVGTTVTTVTEPTQPTNFVSCSGTTVITPSNPSIPPAPPATNTPLLCTNAANYNDIKTKCVSCASLTKYPAEDCIIDLCLSGQSPSTFECPGLPGCQSAPVPTQTITSGGYVFATLGDGLVDGSPTSSYCQPFRYRLPAGWQLATNNALSQSTIAAWSWESHCVSTSDGTSFLSKYGLTNPATCPADGCVIKTIDGCFSSNLCGVRLLIQKAVTPVCGNGVLDGTEQCDDGGTTSGDGCSATCQLEPTVNWTCDTSATPTICYPVSNIVSEPEYLPCPLTNTGCKGCLVTVDNQYNGWCCDCSPACCS